MAEALGVVATLKRKVRSLETNLLEWRRCSCTLTRDCQLILELSDDDVDDVALDDLLQPQDHGATADSTHWDGDRHADSADGSRRGKCRVQIDLTSQLKKLEQKRKNKTRCEIEYCWRPPRRDGAAGPVVRTEELMASSAKHCQQFIDQVREAQRQATRKQSIRIGAVLASASASSSSNPRTSADRRSHHVPSSAAASSFGSPNGANDAQKQPFAGASPCSSSNSGKSDEISAPCAPTARMAPPSGTLSDSASSIVSSTFSRDHQASERDKYWSHAQERMRDCEVSAPAGRHSLLLRLTEVPELSFVLPSKRDTIDSPTR